MGRHWYVTITLSAAGGESGDTLNADLLVSMTI
jgi:hypothetical protein